MTDEFAELKKEQPEFIKELVSTARVGRSIGVHLILATQKPAGVVDDEIFSNSRFKICLRVQDKTDSNEMLKRPEAAWLSVTGRAYFQLGNNESLRCSSLDILEQNMNQKKKWLLQMIRK